MKDKSNNLLLERLKRENERLRLENANLKKHLQQKVNKQSIHKKYKTGNSTNDYTPHLTSNASNQFAELLDNYADISVCGFNATGNIIFWNNASEQIFGYSKMEALNKNIYDLIIPFPLQSNFKKRIKDLSSPSDNNSAASHDDLMIDKNGEMVHVLSNLNCLENKPGEYSLYLTSIKLEEVDKKNSLLIEKDHHSNIIFTLGFNSLKSKTLEDCFHNMFEALKKAVPDAIIVVTKFTGSENKAKIAHIHGGEKSIFKSLSDLIGFDITKKTFQRVRDDYYEPLRLRKLEGGFEKLMLAGGAPPFFLKQMKRIAKIEDTYTINISALESSFGNIAILTKRKNTVVNSQLIEAIVFQSAVAMKQVENNLQIQESRSRFEKILNNLPQFVSYVNKDLVYTFANKTYEVKFNLPLNGMIGKKLIDVIGEKAFNKTIKYIERVFRGEQIKYMEKLKYQNGEDLFIEGRLIPDYSNGEVVGYYGVLTDLTDIYNSRDAVAKSEEKYRLLFENSSLGIFHTDKDGLITQYNDSFLKITGFAAEQIEGVNMYDFPISKISLSLNKVFAGIPVTIETELLNPGNANNIPLKVLLSPYFESGNISGVTGIMEDLTSQKKKNELEKKVAVAEESARFKQNFLANMSHEIRTPLTGILGMIDIMEMHVKEDEIKRYIHILRQSGESLREIINQILDFSKIEAGKTQLKKKPFRFDNLQVQTKNLFKTICKKPIQLIFERDPEIPEYLNGDLSRIMQIINNYVSNAVKFTENGTIRVKFENQEKSDDQTTIKVSVKDTGIGIDDAKIKTLFNPFHQIEQDDIRKYDGTGLGLSICFELAKLHGGTTGVKSKKGSGSEFWFSFKAGMVPGEQWMHRNETEPPVNGLSTDKMLNKFQGLRVLFAEDKKVNQQVVKLMLNSLGIKNIIIASDGEEATRFFKPGAYDLILMDIQMPVMDGVSATNYLRKEFTDLPPIVGLSANAFEGDREKYINMGMDDYLTKPVKKEDFVKLIQNLNLKISR